MLTETPVGKKIYRAGIVGCGRIASTFDRDPLRKHIATHAGAYTHIPSVELVAACDLDREKLKSFGEVWKVKNLYENLEEMLSKEKLDILSICTWPETHYKLVKIALQHKVKAIFCEKPITNDLAQADEITELCQKAGAILAVNHSRRWDEGHQEIKDFFLKGGLGKIHAANCYYTAGISNTGTHLLDLLRYFLGDAAWVSASPAPVFGDKDPTLSGQIYFHNGTLVSLTGLDVKDYLIFEIDFYGSLGRLRITASGFEVAYWKVQDSPYFSGYKELAPAELSIDLKKKQSIKNAVEDLLTCIASGKKPLCDEEEGRKALELICAFHESFKQGKRIELPLKERNVRI